MNKKVMGTVISVVFIALLIFITVKTNFTTNKASDELEEYPSGLIEDLPEDRVDTSLDYDAGLEIGQMAPDFELPQLTGGTVRLSEYRGKTVVLNFWASWCPPCRIEMPFMENYYQEYKGAENVEILAVNMTELERGSREKVDEFVAEHELTFPILMDEVSAVMNLYKVMIYPTTYIINAEGKITDKVMVSMDEKYLKELVDNSQ